MNVAGGAASQSPHWSQGTETADTTSALSGSISGAGKSIEIRHVRASSVPNLYSALNRRSCNFLFVARVGLCC